ncbi:MAG: hypothetical protein AB1295_04200 [Candidatus Micrarchaeota archaeon]
MIVKPKNRIETITLELQKLGRKPFTFKECPGILAMVVAGDPRLGTAGAESGNVLIKGHEGSLAQRLKGLSMDARVNSVELFLDSLSRPEQGRPFARCNGMAEGPKKG